MDDETRTGPGLSSLNDALSFVLLLGYSILLLVTIIQLGRIFCYRHSKSSFQFLFLILCLAWTLMRVTLFLLWLAIGSDHVPTYITLPLLWVPLNLECATYTLLVVFYAQVIYRTLWEDYYKVRFFGVWAAGNLLFLITNLVWIVLACLGVITLTSKTGIFLRFLIPAVAFLLLSVLLLTYGILLHRALKNPVALVPFKANGSSVFGISVISMLLLVVFVARTVYCFIMAFEALFFDYFLGESPVFRFLSLFVSELLPTFAILTFFRHVPRRRVLGTPRLPPALYNSINQPVASTYPSGRRGLSSHTVPSLFSNPQRYDSDEEDGGGGSEATNPSQANGLRAAFLRGSNNSGGQLPTSSFSRQVADDALRAILSIRKPEPDPFAQNNLAEVASPSGSYQKLGKSMNSSSGRASASSAGRSASRTAVRDIHNEEDEDDGKDGEESDHDQQ